MCDFSPKAEGVPTFACESERGPFVREVERRDEKRFGDKIYVGNFWVLFVKAILREKPNFLSRILGQ